MSLNHPSKLTDLKGLWAPNLSLREAEMFNNTVLEGNSDLCMHMLNGIIPPQNQREIADVKDAMQSNFERLALVKYISFPYKFLLFPSSSLLIFSFFFCQLVREESTIRRMVWQLADT